jgi:hypothetical protein
MAIYTVHAPPPRKDRDPADPMNLAFVKDGFSWPALFFAVIWMIYHRMWLVLLAYLVVVVGFGWLAMPLIEPAQTSIAILFAFWFALEANEFRRWTMAGTGWRLVGVSEGRGRLAAERNFFAGESAGLAVPVPPVPPASPATPERAAAPQPPQPPHTPVVGLFPEPRPR